MPIEVKLFDDLDAVERDAAGALDRAARPSLFDRLAWYRLTLKHLPQGRLLVLRARGRSGSAWLFLTSDGDKVRALGSWYTLHYGMISDGDGADDLPRAIADALHPLAASVELYPLEDDRLATAFRRAGWLVTVEQAGANWIARTAGLGFDAYWSRRPSRLRNTARRKAQVDGLDAVIHTRVDAAVWADYETVYRASWKPEEGSPAFLRELAEQEGAAGTLRLGIMKRAGAPIAAQFWLVENGVATIHKLAHARSAGALSPGTLLSVAMFRHVLDRDRPSLIDFGAGDDGYKADWMDEVRPLYRLVAHNPRRVAGLRRHVRAIAAKLVRRASRD